MTEETKGKFTYWLIGLFTGGAIAAPVTAFITKKICDNKVEEAEARSKAILVEPVQPVKKTYSEPEPDGIDPNEIDTDIDEEDEKAHERTEAHERYLDMVERYNGTLEMIPYMIDAEKFMEEQYMQKSYINWYEEDNVFEEELMTVDDPYASFGVTDGSELFRDNIDRRDPDTVYVRNEKLTTDFEITRVHGSYAKLVGGETSLGETTT